MCSSYVYKLLKEIEVHGSLYNSELQTSKIGSCDMFRGIVEHLCEAVLTLVLEAQRTLYISIMTI